jgi:hypothetical protein
MADEPKPRQKERFTMLEPSGPLNPSPEELATRVVDIAFKDRFTMLEPCGPNNPSPEELATRVIEPLINEGPVCDPPQPAVPTTVLSLVAHLFEEIGKHDPKARAAALDFVLNEVNKRRAG